jgi:alpha-galactosidase
MHKMLVGFCGGLVVLAFALLFTGRASVRAAAAAPTGSELTPTPPMGWNSYDSYSGEVMETEVKANADYMAAHLRKYGWQYIVIDADWYFPHPRTDRTQESWEIVMDGNGRLLPAPNRFPSSVGNQGFKPLADYVHSKGLKFGVHIMRGIPRAAVRKNLPILGTTARAQDIANQRNTCEWSTLMYGVDTSKPAGQAYYDSQVALLVQWGVDFIKADDMSMGRNPQGETYHAAEIEALSKAIRKCGRPIVLSLSPGPAPLAQIDHLRSHANLWRISEDMWDNWREIKEHFELCRKWIPYIGPDHWPDADMLPLGRLCIRDFPEPERRSRLTPDEETTLMTLWCIFRSPLMMGGDLPTLDSFTAALLSNQEVLNVDQKSSGNRELFARGGHIAWTANVSGSREKYLAVFNLSDGPPAAVNVEWNELGLNGSCAVRDLWQKKDVGTFADKFSPKLNPHGAGFYKIRPVS